MNNHGNLNQANKPIWKARLSKNFSNFCHIITHSPWLFLTVTLAFVHHHKVDSQPLENAKKVTMTTIWELNTPIIRYTFKGENIDKDNCVQLLSSDTFHYRMQYMGSTACAYFHIYLFEVVICLLAI